MSKIILLVLTGCILQTALLSVVAANSSIHPNVGDYLLVEANWISNPAQELNYTFSDYLSADLANVTITCTNWTALGYSTPPENQGYIVVNITSGLVLEQNPEQVFFPIFFNWTVADNSFIVGNFTYDIVGEENVTRGGQEYPCWKVAPISDVNFLIEKTSGIIFEGVSTQTENEWTISLLEATVDDYRIIPEFPSLLILPLFMIITLLAVIVYRRKHSM